MNQKFDTVEPTKMALLTTLIYVPAYIVTPPLFTPANPTVQTPVVSPTTLLLTPRQAAFTMVVHILFGLTGPPVFSGAMGDPGKLFGPTGGYIMSWIPTAILMSRLKRAYYNFKRYCLVTVLVGMPVVYLVGSAYMKFITGVDWAATFTAAAISFIPLDIFECFAAALVAKPVQIGLSNAQQVR